VRNLDGLYVTLGPVATANRIEGTWDSAFGLETGAYRVREHHAVAALGLSLGTLWFSERAGGRGWLQVEVATKLSGLAVGLSAGPNVELSEHEHPRFGGQIMLWTFVGVMPFARVGMTDEAGVYVDFGLRLALPVLRL